MAEILRTVIVLQADDGEADEFDLPHRSSPFQFESTAVGVLAPQQEDASSAFDTGETLLIDATF